MANDKKESKLMNKLEVRFTDFAIDNFDHSFEFEDEKGRFTKDQLTIPLVDLGPKLKGLKFNNGGWKGAKRGDCVIRAISIATEKPYSLVFNELMDIRKRVNYTINKQTIDRFKVVADKDMRKMSNIVENLIRRYVESKV